MLISEFEVRSLAQHQQRTRLFLDRGVKATKAHTFVRCDSSTGSVPGNKKCELMPKRFNSLSATRVLFKTEMLWPPRRREERNDK